MKKDCWHNKRNAEKTSNATTSQRCVASTFDDEEILYNEATIGFKGGKQFTNVWVIDSEATWHITSRRDCFCTYELVSKGFVFMGNDHALELLVLVISK